jgi:hypothetical protein
MAPKVYSRTCPNIPNMARVRLVQVIDQGDAQICNVDRALAVQFENRKPRICHAHAVSTCLDMDPRPTFGEPHTHTHTVVDLSCVCEYEHSFDKILPSCTVSSVPRTLYHAAPAVGSFRMNNHKSSK